MPANECIPFKLPGSTITGKAVGAVTGKRFVRIAGDRTGGGGSGAAGSLTVGAGLSSDVENVYRIALCNAAGEPAIGVSAHDVVDKGEVRIFAVATGFILPVTAGEVLNAGDLVTTDAEGKAVGLPAKEETAAKAEATVNKTGTLGEEKSIVAVAVNNGYEGNEVSVTILQPPKAAETLKSVTSGKSIVVTPATHATKKETVGGVEYPEITSTAAEVIKAINEDAAGKLLVLANNGAVGKTTGAQMVIAAPKTLLAGGVSGGAGGATVLGQAMTSCDSGKDAEVKLY